MSKLFIYFYRLPMTLSFTIIMCVCFLTVYVYSIYSKRIKCLNRLILTLSIIWILLILFNTVISRINNIQDGVCLIPFYSYYKVFVLGQYEILRSNYMNAMLFLPFGLFTGLIAKNNKSKVLVILFAIILSAFIELVQYKLSIGYCELDDVIHNTLGAVLGSLSVNIYNKIESNRK